MLNSDLDKLNVEGERVSYQDIKDELTSAYLWVQLGSYPMADDELADLLAYIRDKGFVFSNLKIEGTDIAWQGRRLEIKYEHLRNVPIERIIFEND